MSENSDLERTEEPTQRRRDDARKEGRVARSAELMTAILFLGGAAVLQRLGSAAGSGLGASFRSSLHAFDAAVDANQLVPMLQASARTAVGAAVLACGTIALGAVAIGAVQARGVLSMSPLTPQASRIFSLANVRRVLGGSAPVELLRSLFKLAIVGGVAWHVLSSHWLELSQLAARGPIALLSTVNVVGVTLLRNVGLAYLGLAALDYAWQLRRHNQGLRMTKAEVREEIRRQEGDPTLKARIRAIARSRVRRRMMQDVPKADVVIVNPTHVAVALRYDPAVAPAPLVLAMGERLVAQRIREIAEAHGITIVQSVTLARALLRSTRVGSVVPAELYAAVAEVLAFIFRARAARAQHMGGR